MRSIQLITDCEGPLVLNDNAFELCRDLIQPDGVRFFKQVSRYDDYLADVLKKPGYKAGDTLKLILPFLRAWGLTNRLIADYSRKTIKLVPGVKESLRFLLKLGIPVSMVSTSYQQYAGAVAEKLGLGEKNIYCTDLDLNGYSFGDGECEELRRLKNIIAAAPEIELPARAASLRDLPEFSQETVHLLDEIFWKVIPQMKIGKILKDVNPIGGYEKARAVEEVANKMGVDLKDVVYVGDSITDVEAFATVKATGGLAVSFNGNRYAINVAEIAIAADSAWPTALLVVVFARWGKAGILEMIKLNSQPCDLHHLMLLGQQAKKLTRALDECRFRLFNISEGKEAAKIASAYWRKKIRGEAVANLG